MGVVEASVSHERLLARGGVRTTRIGVGTLEAQVEEEMARTKGRERNDEGDMNVSRIE